MHSATQALPFEQLTAAETMAFAGALAHKAPAGAELGSAAFYAWLEAEGAGLVCASDAPLVLTFCRLVMWHSRAVAALRQRGAHVAEQAFEGGVPCACSGEIAHFAAIVPAEGAQPLALRSHAQMERQAGGEGESGEGGGEGALAGAVVFVHDQFATYVEMAKRLCKLCYDKVRARGLQPTFELRLVVNGR